MIDYIRALTNFQASEDRAALYDQAAMNTGFPCWVERYPMPKHAGDHKRGTLGDAILRLLRDVGDDFEDCYDPAQCAGLWSLWTEWGGREHGPFWREVERLDAAAKATP